METGMALIQNLLDISSTALQGGKVKPEGAPNNLLDALAGGEESFLATLLDLASGKNFQNPGSFTLLDTLLSEATDEGINLTALVDLIRGKMPLFSDSGEMKDFVKTPIGVKEDTGDKVSGKKSEPGGDTALPGTGNRINASLFKALGADIAVSGTDKQIDASLLEILDVDPGESETGNQIVTSLFETLDTNVDKLLTPNGATGKKDTDSESPLPSESVLGKGEIDELKSGPKILRPATLFKKYENASINTGNTAQMTVVSEKEDSANSLAPKTALPSEPIPEKGQEHPENQDKIPQMKFIFGKEDMPNNVQSRVSYDSEPGPMNRKDGEVRLEKDIPKEMGGQKDLDPDSVNQAKVVQHAGQGIQEVKHISEKVGKGTPLGPESGSTQNEEVTDKAVTTLQRPSPILQNHDPDSAKPARIMPDSGNGVGKVDLNSSVGDRETASHWESGRQKSEEGNSKTGTEAPRISILQKNLETDTSGISRNPQFKETTTDMAKLPLEEKSDLQKQNPLDSEKGEKDRFIDSISRQTGNLSINPDSGPKNLNTRPEAAKVMEFNQDMAGTKVVNLDAATGEDAQSSSNNHFSEKTLESIVQTKGMQTAQRPLQDNVMSQLVEKAVMSLRNGQSSINISLKPEVLGQLRMQIKTEDNHVMIRIHTGHPLVKEIIESNANQLRAELQNQGLEMEKFDVSVDQGLHQNQGAPKNLRFQAIAGETDDEYIEEGLVKENKENRTSESLIDFFA